jgi:hypothetical protein
MSRDINLDAPSDEDLDYLAKRGRTVEQERARQEEMDLIEGRVTTDADQLPARLAYMQRNGGPVLGDPARGRLRKPRQF